MATTKLKIVLTDAEVQKIRLAKERVYGITMAAPLTSGGNAFVSIDTTEGWNNRTTYVPRNGEIVIYSDRHVIDGVNHPGIKIGDGMAYAVDLPFLNDDMFDEVYEIVLEHISNTYIHVSAEDRTFWNNKINVGIDEEAETLIFNRE